MSSALTTTYENSYFQRSIRPFVWQGAGMSGVGRQPRARRAGVSKRVRPSRDRLPG